VVHEAMCPRANVELRESVFAADLSELAAINVAHVDAGLVTNVGQDVDEALTPASLG